VLADPRAEKPAQVAAREIDWAELMEDVNERDVDILTRAAGTLTNTELSRRWGVSCARVSQLKAELGPQVQLRWGDGALGRCSGQDRLVARLRTGSARTQRLSPCAAGLKEGLLRKQLFFLSIGSH